MANITDITHKSGYTGKGYTQNGRTYTDYGALVRTDGFYYPKGAKISPNGMYYDNGNGWQFAKEGVAFKNGKVIGHQPNSMTGASPGAEVMRFNKSGGSSGGSTVTPDATTPDTTTPDSTTVDDVALELRRREIERQLQEYANWQKSLRGY